MFHRLPRTSARCSRWITAILLTLIITLQTLDLYLSTNVILVDSIPKCSVDTRRQHIRQTCHKRGWSRDLNKTDASNYWRLLVDDQHHVLYCVIPKVACSSFKTFIISHANQTVTSLAIQTGTDHVIKPVNRTVADHTTKPVNRTVTHHMTKPVNHSVTDDGPPQVSVHSIEYLNSAGLGYLSQPYLGGVGHRLDTYHTMLAVRHPFDRLVSAYKDKFLHHNAFPVMYRQLFRNYYKDAVPYDQFGIIRPTFSQFLGMIVNFYHSGFRDRHWLSYYDLCHPCDVRYDDVIKLETLGDDLGGFTTRYSEMNVDDSFPLLNTLVKAPEERNNLLESSLMFSDVHPAIIKELLLIYEKDFELFGYSWSNEFGAGCDSTRDEELNQCC